MSDQNKMQTQQQQQQQQQQQAAQQQMEQQHQQGQTIQVQISHDGTQQLHAQAQVVSSSGGSIMVPTSTMVMASPQQTMLQQNMGGMQNMGSPPTIAPMPSHSGSTTITTALSQQQMNDWSHGRVQVIQQQLQNPTYLQQVYNPQGQLLMPGNIALHHPGMNQGSIQVIAAGKPFQQGQMQHMLTSKPMVQGQTASFPTGYTTIPSSGNNQQTLVISQLGVQHLLPQQQQQQQQPQQQQPQTPQKNDMQKQMMTKANGNGTTMKVASSQQQSVTIGNQPQTISSQAGTLLQQQILSPIQYTQQQRGMPQGATQAMQFAPWQPTFPTNLPQGLTWTPSAIQSPTTLLTAQGNQIFIRGTQPEQNMFHIQQQQVPTHQTMPTQQMTKATQPVELQQKAAIPKTFSNILPNSNKVRTKTVVGRNVPNMSAQKSDAANQTKGAVVNHSLQPKINGGQGVAAQQDKMMRLAHAAQVQQAQQQAQQQANHIASVQQQVQQVQQFMFQNQIQTKPGTQQVAGQMMMQGQIVTSAPQGVDNRPVMPVVSLPPGVQQSLMAPMVVQNVEQVQAYQSQNQQMIATIPMKVTENEEVSKDDIQLVGGVGPGRPDAESAPVEVTTDLTTQTSSESADESQASQQSIGKSDSSQSTDDKLADKENADRVEKTAPAKAMVAVKPQIFTHVIEGFVIQESSEPFPVHRNGMDMIRTAAIANSVLDEPPKKKIGLDTPSKETSKCEVCGKVDLTSKFKAPSKRFCSLSCSKSSRVGLYKDDGKEAAEADCEKSSSVMNGEPAVAPTIKPVVNPANWTVQEVYDFIKSQPGCEDFAEEFALQEIDGKALMLLKPDHLMSVMSIKLGPALKIVSMIDTIRIEQPEPSPKPS